MELIIIFAFSIIYYTVSEMVERYNKKRNVQRKACAAGNSRSALNMTYLTTQNDKSVA